MDKYTNKYQTLRNSISSNDKELIIYGADSFAQFNRRDASVNSKCDRVLPVACHDDLVVLRGELDLDYYNWLKSYGMGPNHIVQYEAQSEDMTLSELIVKDPEPIQKIIQKTGRKPVYVPWFSGPMEAKAAQTLGADLFGASEYLTQRYNDKASFKNICRQLDIPVVEGGSFKMHSEKSENCQEMTELVKSYLSRYKTVIIRGTLSEAGTSLYKTEGNDMAQLYQEIASSGEKEVMIEPFLTVNFSPSDHWVIGRDSKISHIGMRNQVCEQGMIHVGTLKGETFSPDISDYITKTSMKIVNQMSESGYSGVVGIDYIVSEEGIFPIENNARFNASSYIDMLVNNIENITSPIPYWEFIKIKTNPCSFHVLTERINSILYDGEKLNSVFPFNCDALPISGDFSIVLLAQNYNQILHLKESLKEMGVTRDTINYKVRHLD